MAPNTPNTRRLLVRFWRWLVAEPLVHFLLLGALIFVAHYAISTGARSQKDPITVSANDLVQSFTHQIAWRPLRLEYIYPGAQSPALKLHLAAEEPGMEVV